MDHLPVIPLPVVTVGSFDGVHAGHRVIIGRLQALARQVSGSSVLITFHPHPRKVLYPETKGKELRLITSQAEKIRLLEECGLDHLIILEFTLDFAGTSSEDFVRLYLVDMLHAYTIVVGFNHYFGHHREGNFDSLYRLREKYGFEVEEIPMQEVQNEKVSSTKIRKALAEGNIQRANAYLEHHYMILARAELDPGRTTQFNQSCFQIANSDPLKLLPPTGGYAVSVLNGRSSAKGLVYIGAEEALFLPLDAASLSESSEAAIRFHKRISGAGALNPADLLDVVRELIY